MVWIVSEAELRELWQNGKSVLPVFPLGTRFTPAASDFLGDHHLTPLFSEDAKELFFTPSQEKHFNNSREICERQIPHTIYTETDILDLSSQGVTEIVLREGIILTDLAREKAFKVGLQIVQDKHDQPTISIKASHNTYRYFDFTRMSIRKELDLGKTIYTDEDIEKMHHDGQNIILVNDQTIMTDLAKEKAVLFGMQISTGENNSPRINDGDEAKLFAIIKQKVMARIGSSMDENTVDAVIHKVISSLS